MREDFSKLKSRKFFFLLTIVLLASFVGNILYCYVLDQYNSSRSRVSRGKFANSYVKTGYFLSSADKHNKGMFDRSVYINSSRTRLIKIIHWNADSSRLEKSFRGDGLDTIYIMKKRLLFKNLSQYNHYYDASSNTEVIVVWRWFRITAGETEKIFGWIEAGLLK